MRLLIEPQHEMYGNFFITNLIIRLLVIEPQHEMYGNMKFKIGDRVRNTIEPQHEMYGNLLRQRSVSRLYNRTST